MIDIKAEEHNIYMVASEKLDDKDYDRMLPLVKQKIEEYGQISWYFRMKNFKGWAPHAFWRDIKFDFENADKLNKVAVVGEKKWQELMADALKPFTSADVKYFDEENAAKAKEWIDNSN
ncbi:STAS/SEC14 domain-containing protein [Mangrovivirga sp. M17]|uniref:STAS/SEC14 domain-containing protein n=1 Tax=Mangrovivirga halotolerans TaxID=2993936 RepID=A0ABT3RNP9_9BACT|nr:STAS/SEC14 domain-containing protein [Mangrovivirga halotolerans]MCX2743217.1 STAS/SEC14 domain-containing protein [Mangrovivirga halotolerans]